METFSIWYISDKGRIVGGKEAKAHSWPWMVYLDFGRKACGGTIIHPSYILTAVHCVHREPLPRIIVGAHDKTSKRNQIAVAKKIVLFPEVALNINIYTIEYHIKTVLGI